jgi:2-polyprenyl-3-methyl-5-hydroxy-6-metoxy-1,4-benzoquinol methylase
MIYANPVPADLAGGEFYDALAQPFYLSPDKLESDYSSVRFERELKLFSHFCPRGNVLDVGCSTGAFLFQLNARFPGRYEILGTDVSKPALEYAAGRGVRIIADSFLDHDFGPQRFDAVCFWAVMEHLSEPARFLQKATSLLKEGGHCFILVPNLDSLAVRILGAKYRYIFPQHLNYFAPKTLSALIAKEPSLSQSALVSMHFNPIVISQDFRGKGAFVPDQERAALLKKTTAMKRNPLMRPIKWMYQACEWGLNQFRLGDNICLVAQKKGLPR